MRQQTVFKGLAGAAAMAGASQAYGTVVNVTPPANITGYAPVTAASATAVFARVDLDGNGSRDIEFAYRDILESGGGAFLLSYVYAGGSTSPNTPGMVVGSAISGQTYAFSLSAGYKVGPTTTYFYQTAGYLGHIVSNYKGTNYGFTNYLGQAGKPTFTGFEFKTSAGTYDYGYAETEIDPYVSAANPGGLKFIALAYDNSGAAITIPAAVPEPGSLAALAMGVATCAGVAVKRRRSAANA